MTRSVISACPFPCRTINRNRPARGTPSFRASLLALPLGMTTALLADPATAQQLIQQYFPTDVPGYAPNFSASVADRLITQNLAQGINVGSFVVRPSVSEGFGYNSNTLGLPNTGSSSESTSAGVSVRSDWGRDSLGVSANINDQRYLDIPVASYTNWSVGLGGSKSLGRDLVTAAYSHLALHLSATDLGVFGVTTPAPYSVDDVRLSYLTLPGRFSITPSFEYENFAFGSASGSTNIDYSSLSHQVEVGALTTRYELSTGNAVVAILRGSTAQFQPPPGVLANDYYDIAGFLGLDFRADSLVQYRFLVGAEHRGFSAQNFSSADTPTFEVDAVWTPTQLDSVTASAFRRLDDPESPFARNQTISFGLLQYDHELTRTIFIHAEGGLGASESQSNTLGSRNNDQTQYRLGARATWHVNRNLSTSLSYGFNHSHSSSNLSAVDAVTAFGTNINSFTSNTVSISATLFE